MASTDRYFIRVTGIGEVTLQDEVPHSAITDPLVRAQYVQRFKELVARTFDNPDNVAFTVESGELR